jgi:hypothetical protein
MFKMYLTNLLNLFKKKKYIIVKGQFKNELNFNPQKKR